MLRDSSNLILLFFTFVTSALAVDFESDVAPILEKHCLRCHSDGQRKGEFSLSTSGDLLENYVIPGDPEGSYLIDLIAGTDGDKPMMPKESDPLSAEQVAVIREWIKSGASWKEGLTLEEPAMTDLDWWSLKPIQAPTPPTETSHPVDAFINRKLQQHNLNPTDQAAPEVLLRRVTYDLTGLPPTPDQISQFEKEWSANSNKAWEDLVDRLLAAQEFGEKFGRHWLDIARYAETHGYDKDKPRMNAWPYRDYVIRSFNEDKPYDQFVREQVAGDVLYPGTEDGVLGLGFLAAGPWDFIGHWEVGERKLDGRIAKHLDRDEMVSAVFNVFMSTTIQCAQCHHHKFDPIQMKDYYQLHAVFAAIDRADRVYSGLAPEEERQKQKLLAELNQLKQERQKLNSDINQKLAARVSDIDERIDELTKQYGTSLKPEYGYHSQIVKQQNTPKWVQIDLGQSTPVSRVRLIPAFDNYANIGAGFGFPVRYKVEGSNDSKFPAESTRIILNNTGEDQPNPKSQIIEGSVQDEEFQFIRITATKLAERTNDYILALGEVEVIDTAGKNIASGCEVTALDSIEAPVRWGKKNLVDGIFHRRLSDPTALTELHELERKRAVIEQEVRTPEADQRLSEIDVESDKLQKELNTFPEGKLVYAAATHFNRGGQFIPTEGQPRPIHLLARGDLRSPVEKMLPGAPELWSDAQAELVTTGDTAGEATYSEGEARAELAEYLTRDDNPLFWRSIANRLWQWTMGTPLVGTPNDFGRMGMLPTHPELLDYLANKLRNDPQHSLKSIVRLIVTSETYRRSSEHNAENAAIDAGNQFRWQFPRRRLTAEEFRDSLLSVAGALRLDARGGPSFQDFVIDKPQHSPHYEYYKHDPNDPASHRRTVYRFIVRSQPQPMLTTLDCPDPSMSVAQRDESTTALQALTQWNHRLVEAMSRRFAERIESVESNTGSIQLACQLAWGRIPNESEQKILQDVLNEHGAETLARILFNSSAFTYID